MYRWYNDSSGFHPFTGDGGFSFFAGKFGLHIGHNNMMFQNYGSSVSCGVIRDIKLGAKYLSWDMLFKKSYYATARDELEKNKDSMNELEGIGKNLVMT